MHKKNLENWISCLEKIKNKFFVCKNRIESLIQKRKNKTTNKGNIRKGGDKQEWENKEKINKILKIQ